MIRGSLSGLYGVFRNHRPPIAFIGSGLSNNCLSWPQFICDLAHRADEQHSAEWLEKKISDTDNYTPVEDLLAIARESIDSIASDTDLAKFVRGLFFDKEDIPPVFEAIVRSPFAYYVTTNYDNNIEKAYKCCHGEELESFTFDSPEEVLSRIAIGKKFVLKLHGCAAKGREFVISDKNYKEIIHSRPAVRLMVSTIFSSQPVVFMGYGHRDPHISSYLIEHRATLLKGGQSHFTFRKTEDPFPYDLAKLYKEIYGISSVGIEDWSEIETILSQLSYVRLSDRYTDTRLENHANFIKFTSNEDPTVKWGALLYAAASSYIGRGEVSKILWNAVESNVNLRQKIEAEVGLHVIYLLVVGQYCKRRLDFKHAETIFSKLEELVNEESSIIPTLKAKSLRYAALFWMAYDRTRAISLLQEADNIGQDIDREEKINIKKWKLVINGSEESVDQLLELARNARNEGYVSAAAWCRFGGVNLAFDRASSLDKRQQEELQKAIVEFESIDHLQGLAEAYLLLCRFWANMGIDEEGNKERLNMVIGIAKMCILTSTQDRAEKLLDSL